MIIHFHEELKLKEIKDYFHQCYPFLKIAFFKFPHNRMEAVDLPVEWSDDITAVEAGGEGFGRLLEIHFWQKTGWVESHFSRDFNLHAQIFRMNDSDWIETAGSDGLTLEEQNEIGRKSSESYLHGHLIAGWPEKRL